MKRKILGTPKMKKVRNHLLKSVISPVFLATERTSPHRTFSVLDGANDFTRTPAIGSLVYCQLSSAEHSGIYIGGGKIIELTGKGHVKSVTPKGFTGNLFSLDKDIFIPIDRQTRRPIGSAATAQRAKLNMWQRRNYHLLTDNCHQFSTGCMTGDFENDCNYLVMVKQEYAKCVGLAESEIVWARWKWYLG